MTRDPVRVLVAGATSKLGRALSAELLARGHAVRVLIRDRSRAPADVEVHQGDVTRPDTLVGACDGIDVVVSAVGAPVAPVWKWPETTFEAVDVGGNLALLAEAERAGVGRFVYVSVFGTYPPGMRYVEAHEEVVAAIRASNVQATIVRPTGFHSALTMLVDLARWGIGGVVGAGLGRSNPIADADLAVVLADAVTDDADVTSDADEISSARAAPHDIEAGGPDVLTRREIWELAFRAVGKRPLLIPVPYALVRLQAALIRPFNRRLGDLLAFFGFVMTHDAVAPVRGRISLEQSLREHAGGQAGDGR